jgi:hypothetical protein
MPKPRTANGATVNEYSKALRAVAAAASISLLFAGAGCTENPSAGAPRLDGMSEMGKTLTPEEQKQAISDLLKAGNAQEGRQ